MTKTALRSVLASAVRGGIAATCDTICGKDGISAVSGCCPRYIPCYGKMHMVCRKMDHDLRPGNLVNILTMPIGRMALLKERVESLPTPNEVLPHLVVEMVEN